MPPTKRKRKPTTKKENNKKKKKKQQQKTIREVLTNLKKVYEENEWNTDPFDGLVSDDEDERQYLMELTEIAEMYSADQETANALQHCYTGMLYDGNIKTTTFMNFLNNSTEINNRVCRYTIRHACV